MKIQKLEIVCNQEGEEFRTGDIVHVVTLSGKQYWGKIINIGREDITLDISERFDSQTKILKYQNIGKIIM